MMNVTSSHDATSEEAFEELIEYHLVNSGNYERGYHEHWSRELALDKYTLFDFLRKTQHKEWDRLRTIHGDQIENRLLQRIVKELDNRGTLDVLRKGIIDYGVRFKLAYFAPASSLNEETKRLFDENRLTVIRQLHFSEKSPQDSVDLVLCVNGLPVSTVELKNQFTGQAATDARRQYQEDRDPRDLLFSFKRRALVHFAVDPDEVWMTTRLNGKDTRFLPFNQGSGGPGNKGGAGNPLNPDGHKTAYLWETIWRKDTWMDILGRFAHLQQDEYFVGGKKLTKESLIFPRYHQWDVVKKLETEVREVGTGENYLIQHSAGSGKSNSIAWLAYRLSSLHNANDQPVYDSVIVVSDRRVLDRQLQDNIYQFQHEQGVVVKIDKDSKQLTQALEAGEKIIITTLQKFPFIVDQIDNLPRRKYAVIVDEAHSSQTGEAADKLKETLADYKTSGEPEDDNPNEAPDPETYEDVISEKMKIRKAKHSNLSFFAFTATPKPKTLATFGKLGPGGMPCAWHLYSMRQAIEEGFILDVLKSYITYQRYFRLCKAVEDDPLLSKKQANRAIARFLDLHPHNLAQKVEVIVEHFRQFVSHKIGGRAKAMVVTGSRLHAVRYKQEVDKYLNEKGYSEIKALVAFSGTVRDDYDLEHTEAQMNGFGERELPDKFAGDEYQVLIVADKYQTGFDQPLLHTIYVDKKLSGVRAVQTLSRLNRTHPGKEDTFVLDFVNRSEDMQTAFQPFYEETTIEGEIDPNQLYDLKTRIEGADVVRIQDVEEFARVFFQPRNLRTLQNHALLNKNIDPAVTRWRDKQEDERAAFKAQVSAFVRLYSFLSQVMPFNDSELEKLYAYCRLLITKLIDDAATARLQLSDEIALEYYRLQKISEGTVTLQVNEESGLRVPADVGTGAVPTGEQEPLSNIIKYLNDQFSTNFTQADQLYFEQIEEALVSDDKLASQARTNSIENFRYPFTDVFMEKVIERMEANQEITDKLINEEKFNDAVKDYLLQRIYTRLQGNMS